MADRDTEVLTLRANLVSSRSGLLRLLNRPLLRSLLYLGGDLVALVAAHMVAVRLIQHFLRLSMSSLNPSQYHRYYIPFFALVLYFFEATRIRNSAGLNASWNWVARLCR